VFEQDLAIADGLQALGPLEPSTKVCGNNKSAMNSAFKLACHKLFVSIQNIIVVQLTHQKDDCEVVVEAFQSDAQTESTTTNE
jgi:hypothetical protein